MPAGPSIKARWTRGAEGRAPHLEEEQPALAERQEAQKQPAAQLGHLP